MSTVPSVFLCYRRADEPFATALLGVALAEQFGADNVFLDTLSLRSRRRFERELVARARSTAVLLVIAGKQWDRGRNRERLNLPEDWVRTEIHEAHEAGARIVTVLVERDDRPLEPPPELAFLLDCTTVHVRRPRVVDDVRRIADLIAADPATAVSADFALDHATVGRAALAMLRHVLPGPQQSMKNDRALARAVAGALEPGDWLRFAGTGRSSNRRPRGSGIVLLTDNEVRLVELGESPGVFNTQIRTLGINRRPLGPATTVHVEPTRLLWQERADVHVTVPGHPTLSVLGMFPKPARLLRAMADPTAEPMS